MNRMFRIDVGIWLAVEALCAVFQFPERIGRELPLSWYVNSLIFTLCMGIIWLLFRDVARRVNRLVGWLSLAILLSLLAAFAAWWTTSMAFSLFPVSGCSRGLPAYTMLFAGIIWGVGSEIICFSTSPART